MEERLDQLEHSVRSLQETVESLEGRIAHLEESGGTAPAARQAAADLLDDFDESFSVGSDFSGMLPLIGRLFLVLGGAFLLRAVTESATVPQTLGLLGGFIYSLVWLYLADRAGGAGNKMSALFHGLSASLIAFPLASEVCTKFQLLSVQSSAAVVIFMAALGFAVAARRDLPLLAWVITLAAIGTNGALLFGTYALETISVVAIVIGLAALLLAYVRGWDGIKWTAAIVADVTVLWLVLVASVDGGPAGAWADVSPALAHWVCILLAAGYLASFVIRTLALGRPVGTFELVQSAAVLAIGFGGAVIIAEAAGISTGLIGMAIFLGGSSGYGVAFFHVRARTGRGNNFFYGATLAAVFVLIGSALLLQPATLAHLWGTIAVAAAILGARFDRPSLRAHAAVYGVLALERAGWLGAPAGRLFGKMMENPAPSLGAVVALAVVVAAYLALVFMRKRREAPALLRVPRIALLIGVAIGIGSTLAAVAMAMLAPDSAGGDATPQVAVARTVIIALTAITFAAIRKHADLPEAAWPAYAALLLGGLKLVVGEMATGNTLILFIDFAVYGLALIITSRLLRQASLAGARAKPEKDDNF